MLLKAQSFHCIVTKRTSQGNAADKINLFLRIVKLLTSRYEFCAIISEVMAGFFDCVVKSAECDDFCINEASLTTKIDVLDINVDVLNMKVDV